MVKSYDQLRLQDEFGCRLRKVLHILHHKLGGAPNVAGQLTQCRELFGSRRAWNDQDLLPSPVPTSSRCDSDKLVAIVLHEVKLAIIRWWELIRTGQTTGLDELIGNLEGYAEYGLDECEVLGSPEDGYHIFNRAMQTETVEPSEDTPKPPALAPLSVESVSNDYEGESDPDSIDANSILPTDDTEEDDLAQTFLGLDPPDDDDDVKCGPEGE